MREKKEKERERKNIKGELAKEQKNKGRNEVRRKGGEQRRKEKKRRN